MSNTDRDARFLSTLSHDLRGGVHGVLLALEMLDRDVTEAQPPQTLAADLELARRSLIDIGARAERILIAQRMHTGVMPVRPTQTDIVPSVNQAVRNATAAEENAPDRVRVSLPPRIDIFTDARLVGEIVSGLVDHVMRSLRDAHAVIEIDADGLLSFQVDRPWLVNGSVAILTVATADPPFDSPALGLYVAGAAARLMGCPPDLVSDRVVRFDLAMGDTG